MTIPLIEAPAEFGEVFTRRWVVDLVLDLCGYTAAVDLTQLIAVDPSVGSGAFALPMVERLVAARQLAGSDWTGLASCLRGWDVQPHHVAACRAGARSLLVEAGCSAEVADNLVATWFHVGDFLLDAPRDLRADVVVGNPPYIRIENLESRLLAAYRRECPAMGGRCDVFIGFYGKSLDLLAEGGVLGFICADRWMHNDYGKRLRDKIVSGPFAVDAVISMHDADAFEVDVAAYPAITIIRRGTQRDVVVASAAAAFAAPSVEPFLDWFDTGDEHISTAEITAARMDNWYNSSASWPSGTPEEIAWLERLEELLPGLENPATGTHHHGRLTG